MGALRVDARVARRIALVVSACLLALAGVELAIELFDLGLGKFAFGAVHDHLSSRERFVVAIIGALHVPAALVVLRRAGLATSTMSYTASVRALALIVLYEVWVSWGVLSHTWQRELAGVIGAILAIGCLLIAKSPALEHPDGALA